MKKLYVLIFLALGCATVKAQTDSTAKVPVLTIDDLLYKTDYPEGVYLTKEDFIAKTPAHQKAVLTKPVLVSKKQPMPAVPAHCFFLDSATNKKVKDAFAISHKGHLYIQEYAILQNRNKTDRAQTTSTPFAYVRVLNGGKNYLYTELELANAWAQGAMYGGFGVAGGIAAANMVKAKGIVWDFANKEFNIFKNCKDYNAFIKQHLPDMEQTCENQQPNIASVRDAIDRIK